MSNPQEDAEAIRDSIQAFLEKLEPIDNYSKLVIDIFFEIVLKSKNHH